MVKIDLHLILFSITKTLDYRIFSLSLSLSLSIFIYSFIYVYNKSTFYTNTHTKSHGFVFFESPLSVKSTLGIYGSINDIPIIDIEIRHTYRKGQYGKNFSQTRSSQLLKQLELFPNW